MNKFGFMQQTSSLNSTTEEDDRIVETTGDGIVSNSFGGDV